MKKLSEVCKIVGVTRRTLQEYERIELLKPTSKTESGYWLYDDVAIKKLILIRIFIEGGYERKKIKSLLESPTLDILQEFDSLIATLEEKRKRIDGMINTIKTLKLTAKLPESTLCAMRNIDVSCIYKDKSFSSYLEESITQSAEYSEFDGTESEVFMPFWYNLIAIGCLMGTPVGDESVQLVVDGAYKRLMEMVMEDQNDSDEVTEGERVEVFLEGIQYILSDSELQKMVELQCGDGATDYIIEATHAFRGRKKNNLAVDQKGDK